LACVFFGAAAFALVPAAFFVAFASDFLPALGFADAFFFPAPALAALFFAVALAVAAFFAAFAFFLPTVLLAFLLAFLLAISSTAFLRRTDIAGGDPIRITRMIRE
jgi:hypothetical protein